MCVKELAPHRQTYALLQPWSCPFTTTKHLGFGVVALLAIDGPVLGTPATVLVTSSAATGYRIAPYSERRSLIQRACANAQGGANIIP